MSGTKAPKDRSQIWSSPPKTIDNPRRDSLESSAKEGAVGPPRRPSMQRIPLRRSDSVPNLKRSSLPATPRRDSKRKSVAHTLYDSSEIGVKKPDWRHYASTLELRERQGSVAVAFTVVDDGHPPGYVKPISEVGRKQSFSSAPPPRQSIIVAPSGPRKSVYRDNSHERKSVYQNNGEKPEPSPSDSELKTLF
jgi:hypothetical protein